MSDRKKKAEQALLLAEVEFLRAHDWAPYTPLKPGGEVMWKDQCGSMYAQTSAVAIQRGRNIE
jgi:hypothetical protein